MPSTRNKQTNKHTTNTTMTMGQTPEYAAKKESIGGGSTKQVAAKNNYSDLEHYWRYDEAAPPVQNAKVYQVQSLPTDYRLGSSAKKNLTEYLLQRQNRYPQKLHVFEINPSITALPPRYRVPLSFDDDNNNNIPLYLASYRITTNHNCGTNVKALMYGDGDYSAAKKMRKTNFLGLALLKDDLTVLADVVVMMNNTHLPRPFSFSDFRLYTLHDELYLTTSLFIGRLELGLPERESSTTTNSDTFLTGEKSPFVQLQHVDTTRQFSVFFSKKFACPTVFNRHEVSSKNLLYFVDDNNNIMTEYFLSTTNNDVRAINFQKKCQPIFPKKSKEDDEEPKTTSSSVSPPKKNVPTFRNFHEKQFPRQASSFLLGDRGSACCVRMNDQWTGREYLAGVSHPKTPYPGKQLPEGVIPNIYLSRFFAMEASPPYTIVARTGAFCFGYPRTEEIQGFTTLWHDRVDTMFMSEDTFDCPRIHFVMSMIDNVADDSQVVISYGVSDCNSRFITVNKVDIQAMLWPAAPVEQGNNYNGTVMR
jgi:hypothetical protein